MVDMAWGWNGS